jgi:hypothetical protein
LKLGGYGLLAASVDAAWPLRLAASGRKSHPRGNARNVLFLDISGAVSHVESFDFKENAGTPKDLDVRKLHSDLQLSHLLFPRLESQVDKLAIVRSLLSHEGASWQCYVRWAPAQPCLARDSAIGCVMASN